MNSAASNTPQDRILKQTERTDLSALRDRIRAKFSLHVGISAIAHTKI